MVLEEHESMVTDGEHSGAATAGACRSDPCGAAVLTAGLNLGGGRAEEEVEEEGGEGREGAHAGAAADTDKGAGGGHGEVAIGGDRGRGGISAPVDERAGAASLAVPLAGRTALNEAVEEGSIRRGGGEGVAGGSRGGV